MDAHTRWITLEGAVNVRDLGGLGTVDGRTTRFGRVLRSDNLQGLSPGDVEVLIGELRLSDVIDLRSAAEVRLEGPGPLTAITGVAIHHLSLFAEGGTHTDVAADQNTDADTAGVSAQAHLDLDRVLPWQTRRDHHVPAENRTIGHYLGYLADRPDAVIDALRVMAYSSGAAIVHCAAGKDRTGVVCALALEAVGTVREAVVADYAQTGERLAEILDRLRSSETYAADLDSRPAEGHLPRPAMMDKLLATLDERHGGPLRWMTDHGWTPADQKALRARLL